MLKSKQQLKKQRQKLQMSLTKKMPGKKKSRIRGHLKWATEIRNSFVKFKRLVQAVGNESAEGWSEKCRRERKKKKTLAHVLGSGGEGECWNREMEGESWKEEERFPEAGYYFKNLQTLPIMFTSPEKILDMCLLYYLQWWNNTCLL